MKWLNPKLKFWIKSKHNCYQTRTDVLPEYGSDSPTILDLPQKDVTVEVLTICLKTLDFRKKFQMQTKRDFYHFFSLGYYSVGTTRISVMGGRKVFKPYDVQLH